MPGSSIAVRALRGRPPSATQAGPIVPIVFSLVMAELTGHRVQELKHTYDFDQDE